MEETERIVRTWMTSGRDEEIDKILLDIKSGKSTLLDIVKALGECLTSEEDVLRSKGVDLLSRVIEQCPPEKINRQATRTLVAFYCGKLEDSDSTTPALKGLLSLATLPTFTSSDAGNVIKAAFAHIKFMSLPQPTRHLLWRILDALVAHHRRALQGMGDDFLSGYTILVDGERDPRNLMLAFSINRVICIEFDISHRIQGMFDIIFCYFPITYRPLADDPYGITTEELQNALQSCITASPLFGPIAFPLFLEKLLAGSPLTKLHILETISSSIPIYGARATREFSKQLWNSLKLEVFQPVNPDIEKSALKTIQILIQTCYSTTQEADAPEKIEGLVKKICEECLELLGEPEKSQAIPASKVMASLIGTTPKISRYALQQSIPHLMKLFRDPGELNHRQQILTLLCIHVAAIDTKRLELDDTLLSSKDDVLSAFIAGIKSVSSREPALDGLKRLIQMDGILSNEELVFIVHNINEILHSDSDIAEDASDDVLDVLITIADHNSKIVEESTLPLLFNSLPDIAPSRSAHVERAKCWSTLRMLARLCISNTLFETLVVRLSTKLDIIYTPTRDHSIEDDSEACSAYAHSILKTLASVLELKINAKHTDITKYADRLVPRLYSLFIYLSLDSEKRGVPKTDVRPLLVAGHIITLVVQTLSTDRQLKVAQALYSAYFEGEVKKLTSGHHVLPVGMDFSPFKDYATSAQRDLVILFSAAILAFRNEVFPSKQDPNEFLYSLQVWSIVRADSDAQREAVHYAISSLLNKNVEKLSSFLSNQSISVWNGESQDTSSSVSRRKAVIASWLWIAKALVIRNHESTFEFVEKLSELFDEPELGWDAARAIGRIAGGGERILTKGNNAIIRVLYAQRYFQKLLPRMLQELQGAIQTPRQRANLVALTSLITYLPKAVYIGEMPTLMPLLVRGLDLSDVDIRSTIFKTLLAVAENDAKSSTQEHATTLVTIALKNTLPQDYTSPNLRIMALKYLTALPSVVRYDVLHPYKPTVLRELGKALDDPRRVVRKEAADARSTWFLYRG